MVVLIDFYDSFTYNILDYLRQCYDKCELYRCSEVDKNSIHHAKGIVLSPGPGKPQDYPLINEVIEFCIQNKTPLLGVCLGHQGIGTYFGGQLQKASKPVHGKTSLITHNEHAMYSGIPKKINVARYHSLILNKINNNAVEVTATTANGVNMSLAHKELPIWGVQYHPEAIQTEYGLKIFTNWIDCVT